MPVTGSCYALFDTSLGRCALLWRGGLVVGAALPEGDEARLRSSIERRFPGAKEAEPPAGIARAMDRIVALLAGEREDLGDVAVDLASLPEFERLVLQATRRIPCGETRTYGEIAAELGSPGAARAVGRALGRNPVPIIIPCHRVLAAAGRSGGFSAPGGASTKLKMLEIEGARRGAEPELFERLPWAMRPGA